MSPGMHSNEEPCERCNSFLSRAQSIDALSGPRLDDVVAGKLEAGETRESLSLSSCPICVLLGGIPEQFKSMYISRIIKPAEVMYLPSRTQSFINTADGQVKMQLLETPHGSFLRCRDAPRPLALLTCLDQNAVSILEDLIVSPDFVPYSRIKDWLHTCRADPDHQPFCSLASLAQPAKFRLIDVWDRHVVPAPEEAKYVALSYVWGGIQPDIGFPQVVVDSMQVAKELGYRYLWVDQYVGGHHIRFNY